MRSCLIDLAGVTYRVCSAYSEEEPTAKGDRCVIIYPCEHADFALSSVGGVRLCVGEMLAAAVAFLALHRHLPECELAFKVGGDIFETEIFDTRGGMITLGHLNCKQLFTENVSLGDGTEHRLTTLASTVGRVRAIRAENIGSFDRSVLARLLVCSGLPDCTAAVVYDSDGRFFAYPEGERLTCLAALLSLGDVEKIPLPEGAAYRCSSGVCIPARIISCDLS